MIAKEKKTAAAFMLGNAYCVTQHTAMGSFCRLFVLCCCVGEENRVKIYINLLINYETGENWAIFLQGKISQSLRFFWSRQKTRGSGDENASKAEGWYLRRIVARNVADVDSTVLATYYNSFSQRGHTPTFRAT